MKQELVITEVKKNNFSLKDFMQRQKQNIIPLSALILVIVIFQIASEGKLLTERNLRAIINEGFFTIISAIGLSFVIAQGSLDFSLGGNLAVSCAVAVSVAFINPMLALPAGIVTGLVIGLVNGLVNSRLHVDSFITTLAMKLVLTGLVVVILASGSLGVPMEMLTWDSTETKLIVLVAAAIVGFIAFEYTKVGKWVKAVSAEPAATQSGVPVATARMIGFMIAGGTIGFLAFFNILRTGSASSLTGTGFELDALIAVLLGGMPLTGGTNCRFKSAIIGGLTVTILANGMTMCGLSGEIQQLTRGIIFLLAVMLTFDRKNIPVIK